MYSAGPPPMQVRLSGAQWFLLAGWCSFSWCFGAYKNFATYHIWLQQTFLFLQHLVSFSVWYKNFNFLTKNDVCFIGLYIDFILILFRYSFGFYFTRYSFCKI